jgi:hypothetical protein
MRNIGQAHHAAPGVINRCLFSAVALSVMQRFGAIHEAQNTIRRANVDLSLNVYRQQNQFVAK